MTLLKAAVWYDVVGSSPSGRAKLNATFVYLDRCGVFLVFGIYMSINALFKYKIGYPCGLDARFFHFYG